MKRRDLFKAAAVVAFSGSVAAQDVYISTLETPLPDEDKVVNAVGAWNDALGLDLGFAGYTQHPCVNGAITYRLPSQEEWNRATGDYWLYAAAAVFACRPELSYTGVVVLNSPYWLDVSQGVYTHELGHAIGARHVADPDSIMYSGVVTADEITANDIRAVIDCTPWQGSDGIVRVPALTYGEYRFAAQFSYVGNGLWYVTQREAATPGCIWNYRLPNGTMALWQVYSYGNRYNITLEPVGVYWRVGQLIKLGGVQ